MWWHGPSMGDASPQRASIVGDREWECVDGTEAICDSDRWGAADVDWLTETHSVASNRQQRRTEQLMTIWFKTPFSLQVALRCHTPSEHMHIHTCTGSQQSISCSLTTLLFLSSRDPEAESGTLMWILSSGGASFKCFTDGDICLWTAD